MRTKFTPAAGWAAAGGLAALLAAWRRLLLLGEVPVDGNLIAMGYPHWALARAAWSERSAPLWNPLRNMGEPLLADPQTGILYPPLWAAAGLGDFAAFLRVWIIGHTLLAGAFAALLARRRHPDCPPAWGAAAAAAALGGSFIARATFPNHFASAAWLPAALFALEAGSPLGLGTVLALQWLAGFPPVSVITGLALLAWTAPGGRRALRVLAVGAAWGAALSAAQWMPFLELLGRSGRGLLLPAEIAGQYSVEPGALLKMLLLPQWTALSPESGGDPAIVCLYLGPVGLGLALWAAARGRAAVPAWVAAASLALSLGIPALPLLRFPANWLLPAWAAAAVLCATGTARLGPRWRWPAVCLLTLDLAFFCQRGRAAWSRPELLTERPPLAESLSGAGGRLYHAAGLRAAWQRGTLETEEDYLLMRDFLAPSFGTAFGVREVSSYQTLRSAAAGAFQDRLAREGPGSPSWDWAGVAAWVDLKDAASPVRREKLVLRRRPAPPRAFWADGNGSVEVLEDGPGRLRAAIKREGPGTLVFSEAHFSGWVAEVDGAPAPSAAFEGFFLSVAAPDGAREASFRYRPRPFLFGAAISLLAAAAASFRALRGAWRLR